MLAILVFDILDTIYIFIIHNKSDIFYIFYIITAIYIIDIFVIFDKNDIFEYLDKFDIPCILFVMFLVYLFPLPYYFTNAYTNIQCGHLMVCVFISVTPASKLSLC